MIKRYRWFILFSVAAVATVVWDKKTYTPKPREQAVNLPSPQTLHHRAVAGEAKIHQKKINPSSMHKTEDIEWKENFESNLRDLSEGPTEITIDHERSINWNDHGQIIPAEAVKVTLKGEKKTTNFRALVDSRTGRIIQTWDQPVYDPVNPREGFGIRLDPRYDP